MRLTSRNRGRLLQILNVCCDPVHKVSCSPILSVGFPTMYLGRIGLTISLRLKDDPRSNFVLDARRTHRCIDRKTYRIMSNCYSFKHERCWL